MSEIRKQRINKRDGERGSVLAISIVGMLAFLLATGLCVDISHFYLVKGELQNAADAAALAAVSELNSDDGGITKAVDRAVTVMNKHEFNNTGTTIPRENVRFAVNFGDFDSSKDMSEAEAKQSSVVGKVRFVKVAIPPKSVTVGFAAMIIGKTRNLTAETTAGMSVAPNYFENFIPLTAIDDEVRYFNPGELYTIRRPPGGAVSPGNYQILAIDGSGASDDREGLANNVQKRVAAGDYVQTKPGVSAGAVRQGVNTRFGDYGGGMDPVTSPPDMNVKEGITYDQYLDSKQNGTNFQAPSRGTGVWGRRVVLIPIIKKSEFDNGRDSVQIAYFAAFFLRTKVGNGNGGDIEAEYIGKRVVLGAGGFDPNGGAVSPELSIPVIYR